MENATLLLENKQKHNYYHNWSGSGAGPDYRRSPAAGPVIKNVMLNGARRFRGLIIFDKLVKSPRAAPGYDPIGFCQVILLLFINGVFYWNIYVFINLW